MLNSCENLLLRDTKNISKTLAMISQPARVSFRAEHQVPAAIQIEARYNRTIYHLEEIVCGLKEQQGTIADIFQQFCHELKSASHLNNHYDSESDSFSDLDIGYRVYRPGSDSEDPFENEYFEYSSDDYIT